MAGRDALTRAVARWSLELDGAPIETPRGSIVFARRDGEDVALKLPRGDDEASAVRALASWDGDGAVRVLARSDDALLLERAVPGDDLSGLVGAGRDAEATDILCDVAQRLHARSPPTAAFPTVEAWGRAFDAYAASGDRTIAAATLTRAARLHGELAATQGPRRLLHGGLHHYNVLRDARRGGLAVDPKGVVGEPAYDLGAMLRNSIHRPDLCADTAIVADRVARIAARLDHDRARIIGWAYAQAVLAAIWSWQDDEPAAHFLAIADAVAPLLGD